MSGLTIDNPITLKKALMSSRVIPGDIIALLPGVYRGDFISSLSGSISEPIIIRPYSGNVTIDGSINFASSRNIVLSGIEFTRTNWVSRVFNTWQDIPANLNITTASNIKVRNCIIHDGSQCVVAYGGGMVELYGCLLYNGGENNSEGHTIYTHNHSGVHTDIENNIFLASMNYGFHAHSSGRNNIDNYHLKNNIFGKNNGKNTFGNDSGDPSITVKRINFEANENMGTFWWFNRWSTPLGEDITITNNYFDGSNILEPGCFKIKMMQTITMNGNTMVYPDTPIISIKNPGVPYAYSIDKNTYYGAGGKDFYLYNDVVVPGLSFSEWQALGYDANSTYTTDSPPHRVRVIPNKYDANLCHVAIYNYSMADSVTVDVSAVYSPDEVVKAHQSQDYFNDIQILTVSPTGTIAVDMRAASHSVAVPIGASVGIDPMMCPKYGAFVIKRV